MLLRQLFLVGFISALTVTITERSSIAFTLIPAQPGATSNWRPVSPYLVQDNLGNLFEGRTEVNTSLWTQPIPVGGTGTFRTLLALWAATSEKGFFGWNFQPAELELKGSFEIVNYLACGYSVLCGIENPGEPDIRDNGVGATFYLKYHPAPTDPQPQQQGKQLHWIQMVQANYGVGVPGGPILPGFPFIDNAGERDNPYYDTVGRAGEDFFEDRPYNPGINAAITNNYFEAELYLVEETTPLESQRREVTIYNGIRWGWKNEAYPLCPNNTFRVNGVCLPSQPSKTFSGTLTSGSQTDQYKLDGLTPGNYFYAWTNNSIPSNRCNPNTYLSATSGTGYNYDNDSSPVGDGFASALSGIVPNNGIIDLFVGTHSGRRGEDRGSYELNVKVYDSEPAPPSIIIGSSGGGGVTRPRPGNTQQNPILPTSNSGGWQIFNNVPSCRWYDPYTTYGFEFQALEDTLFTEILDFPVGLDNRFKVSLKLYPHLFRCQLNGLLIGGIILAISIYPQVIDWKIDYTVTMGQVIKENILASTIFQNQQPIGLYSHRGHAAFVLAAISVLFLFSWQEKWLGAVPTTMALIVMIPALVLTQTRAGVLALLGASVYLLGRRYYKRSAIQVPKEPVTCTKGASGPALPPVDILTKDARIMAGFLRTSSLPPRK